MDVPGFTPPAASGLPAGGLPAGGLPAGGLPAGGFPAGGAGAPFVPGLPADFNFENPESFGNFDFGSFEPDFDLPEMKNLLDDMMADFTSFVPDLTLFESFDAGDIDKLNDSLTGYFKELKITVSNSVKRACAEEFAKGKPTEEKLVEIGIPKNVASEIKPDKVNKLFSDINFFENEKPEDIAKDIEDTLKNSKDIKAKLEEGLPKDMDIKKFSQLVNKKGFDTQGLKKMLADPEKFNKEYKVPATKESGRRRSDKDGVKGYAKKQVGNQAQLAGTQQQLAAEQSFNDGSSLFVSTLAIGLSTVGSYFVF